jgi:hypothetical protein
MTLFGCWLLRVPPALAYALRQHNLLSVSRNGGNSSTLGSHALTPVCRVKGAMKITPRHVLVAEIADHLCGPSR